jgi:TRAP-type C4-dicarboxylate transport system substrate-binding protein
MKKMIAMMLALAMALSLAACGGGSSSSSTSESSAPAESSAAESPAEESQDAESPAAEEEEEFAATPTYSLRMSCEASEGQWLAEMLQDYADDVYQATKGQVQIELYLGNSLGSSDDVWSMFTQGTIDMVDAGVAHAGHFPVTDFVQTPFTVDSPECAAYVMNALSEQGMLTEFTDNMHVVAYLPTLMQEYMFVDKEVSTVDDLSGMIIRASSAPLVSCVENLGSTATSIAITDLYMSLSQGVADGTITSVDAADVFKLQDVCKYLLDLPICTGMNFIGINNTTWDKLPADIQAEMDEVGAKYQEIYFDLNNQAKEDCLKNMTDGGMTIITPSDELVAACQEATASQLEELISNLNAEGLDGEAIVAAGQAAVAEYEG